MNSLEFKSNSPMRILVRWINVYISLAFAAWKMSCLYIYGQDGLACEFKVSVWSRMVEAGYVIGVLILVHQAVAQIRAGRQHGRISLIFFAGLGLVFLLAGSGISFAATNTVGSLAALGINALMIYLSWKAWRQLRSRALVCLFWGCMIDLIRSFGVKWYAASTLPGPVGSSNPAAFWLMVNDFGRITLNARWLVEFYWLGGIVSSVLIASGMILLMRQAGAGKPIPHSPNTAKYMGVAIFFLLIGLYPSLAFFRSPGFVTALAVNLAVFASSLVTTPRIKNGAFAWWAWASGITIMTTLARQFHHSWIFPPRVNDQVLLQLLALGSLLAGIFWVGGFMAVVSRLSVTEPSTKNYIEPIPKASIVWFPKPPAWMRSRLAVIIGVGTLIACIIFFRQHDPSDVFSLEPKYEGHTLSYWMDHWYSQPWGGSVNGEAEAALKSMGAKAAPLLVDWIGRPYSSAPGMNYQERALKGFEVLGPAASPAAPKLIKIIGRGDYPIRALVCIGKDAVPALADKYLETLADTSPPVMNWRDPHYPTSPARIQECLIQTFVQMGTNASAAVPVLLRGVSSKSPWTRANAVTALESVALNQPDAVIPELLKAFTNSDATTAAAAAGAMASIGRKRPDMILPVLIGVFTNANTDPVVQGAIAESLAVIGRDRPKLVIPVLIQVFAKPNTNAIQPSGGQGRWPFHPNFSNRMNNPFLYDFNADTRDSVADALAAFGTEAGAAIQLLVQAGESTNATLRAHVAVAVQKIAPEKPHALEPLLKNLTETDAQVRRRALWTLESLGTNAIEALPVLTEKCLHDPDPEVRQQAMSCVSKIGQINDGLVQALNENLIGTNSAASYAAYGVLAGFAARSPAAYASLLKALQSCPDQATRQQIRSYFESAVSRDTTPLETCLTNADSEIRHDALRLADMFRLDLPEIKLALEKALSDPNPEFRAYATNAFLQMDTDLYGNQVAAILVYHGNLEATNALGQTQLHLLMFQSGNYQAAQKQIPAIRALLEAGANPNSRDALGRTPVELLFAEALPWEGVSEKLSLLAGAGADLSIPDNQGKTPLHYLAALGEQRPLSFISGIDQIFADAKVDFNARDDNGDTPLHIAAKTGTRDVFDWLLKRGANLDETNNAGETPRLIAAHNSTGNFAQFGPPSAEIDVFTAAREGAIEPLAALLKADPTLANATNQFGETVLRVAVQAHRTNAVEFLEQHDARWDAVSAVMFMQTQALQELLSRQPADIALKGYGSSLLHLAAANGDVATVKVLLDAGGDLQAKDNRGLSPLGVAELDNQPAVAAIMRQHGATENIFDTAYTGDLKTAAALIARNKSLVFATNVAGVSVSEIAAGTGQADILKLLIDGGASPKFAGKRDGRTPLHFAALYNQIITARLLIQHDANVDAYDRFGFTPLHLASMQGSAEVAAELIKNHADPNKLTIKSSANAVPRMPMVGFGTSVVLPGDSALHLAAVFGQTNIVQLLLESGASVNATDSMERSALDLVTRFTMPTDLVSIRFSIGGMDPLGAAGTPPRFLPFQSIQVRQKINASLLEKAGGRHLQSNQPFRRPPGFPQ